MTIFDFGFPKCIFRTVNVNLWKFGKSVSKLCVCMNDFCKFANNKSIHDDLSGFL